MHFRPLRHYVTVIALSAHDEHVHTFGADSRLVVADTSSPHHHCSAVSLQQQPAVSLAGCFFYLWSFVVTEGDVLVAGNEQHHAVCVYKNELMRF